MLNVIYEMTLKRLLMEGGAPDIGNFSCAIIPTDPVMIALIYVTETVHKFMKSLVESGVDIRRPPGGTHNIANSIIELGGVVSVTGIEERRDKYKCFNAWEHTKAAGDGKFAFGMAYALSLKHGGNGLIIPDRESVSDDARNSFRKEVSKRKSRKMDAPPPDNKTPETEDDCERRWEEGDDPDWDVLDRAYEPSGWEISALDDMLTRWNKDLVSYELAERLAHNYFSLKYHPQWLAYDPEQAMNIMKNMGFEHLVKDVKPAKNAPASRYELIKRKKTLK